MQPQAEASGVKLLVQADAGLPLVPMDPARMRAAISNLLANSLRYTPHGGRVHLEAGADRSVSLASVRVRDTGRGIAADFLPHVFDRFAKSADSTGSGLGLAIAQDIVRAHGGEIHVQSRVGEGTEIRIDLPLGGD
jgi:two-component system sensor histidine kinase BaeS